MSELHIELADLFLEVRGLKEKNIEQFIQTCHIKNCIGTYIQLISFYSTKPIYLNPSGISNYLHTICAITVFRNLVTLTPSKQFSKPMLHYSGMQIHHYLIPCPHFTENIFTFCGHAMSYQSF